MCAQILQTSPFHRPYYTKLNGQFVLIQTTEVSNLSTVEIGENKDKISQRQIILTIDRAYINYDIKELNAGTIYPSDVEFEYNEEDVEKTLNNGAKILKDQTIVNGTEIKNMTNFTPFIYNIADKNGNIIGTTQKGKTKVRIYSLEIKK